jgi:ubiquinone biosynthesis protein UbiJ
MAAINHILAQEAWARDVLALHAGKEAAVDLGRIALRVRVGRDGLLDASQADTPAQVTIHVKPSDLPLMAANRERAFSYVRVEGDAEFANTLSQLAQGLRWEAAHDLQRVLGPLAAERIVQGAGAAAESLRTAHRKLAENLAEYLLEEQPVLVRPAQVEAYAADVSRLRDDVERFDKRLARLEMQAVATLAAPTPPRPDSAAQDEPERSTPDHS